MSFPRFSLSSFVTLFSFQGTIFYIDFKFKQVCVQFAFSSTSSRTSVHKTEKKMRNVREIVWIGGDEENRTPDPLLARQVLSQLSYTPKFYLVPFHVYSKLTFANPFQLPASFILLTGFNRCFATNSPLVGHARFFFTFLQNVIGGPKWTRTTDLTLIRRAL